MPCLDGNKMYLNPKDKIGASKVPLWLVPPVAVAHAAMALVDGAIKYGAYNWRKEKITTTVYIDAAKRHLDDFLDGQELAPDSMVHHLGHVMACCAILLDAISTGMLVDDRPSKGKAAEVYEQLRSHQLLEKFVEARKKSNDGHVEQQRKSTIDGRAAISYGSSPTRPTNGRPD